MSHDSRTATTSWRSTASGRPPGPASTDARAGTARRFVPGLTVRLGGRSWLKWRQDRAALRDARARIHGQDAQRRVGAGDRPRLADGLAQAAATLRGAVVEQRGARGAGRAEAVDR